MLKVKMLKNSMILFEVDSVTERWETNYTGFGMFRYRDGSSGEWGMYKNGKREGKVTRWNREKGVFRGNYINDIAEGIMIAYYISGDMEESNYLNGEKEGESILYKKDGGYEKRYYTIGRKNGEATRYFSNGAREKINYINNSIEGDSIYYYPNGNFEERKYVNNKITGDGILYFDNTYKIIKHNSVIENNTEFQMQAKKDIETLTKRIEILEERLLKSETKKENKEKINSRDILGQKQGKWEEEIRKYMKKIGTYVNNKKQGKWKCYLLDTDEYCKLEQYENNKLIGEEYIIDITSDSSSIFLKWQEDKNGYRQGEWIEKIIRGYKRYSSQVYKKVMNYENNLLQGKYLIYDSDGKIVEVGNYRDNLKNGDIIKYDSNGKIIESGEYIEGKKEGHWFEENKMGCYLNDKRNGIWESILDNSKETYINGLLVGKYYTYYKDGVIESEIDYTDNGKQKEVRKYYKNGKIKEIIRYTYNRWRYLENGRALKSKGTAKYCIGEYNENGEKIGEWKEYDSYEEMVKEEGDYFQLK